MSVLRYVKCYKLLLLLLTSHIVCGAWQEHSSEYVPPVNLEDLGFVGYDPSYILHVESRSKDDNYILYFKNDEPLFLRVFNGRSAEKRCFYYRKILNALTATGIAPYVVAETKNAIIVTFIRGKESRLEDWLNKDNLTRLLKARERFAQALQQYELRKRDLCTLCRDRMQKIKNEQLKKFFMRLVAQWEKKYKRALQETPSTIRHGDLHGNNILLLHDRIWIVDYSLCGEGYLIEDLAQFSLYNALPKESNGYLLEQVFKGHYDDTIDELFEACKALALFAWALVEIEGLSLQELRDALFRVEAPALDKKWFAERSLSRKMIPWEDSKVMLLYAVRSLQKLTAQKKGYG